MLGGWVGSSLGRLASLIRRLVAGTSLPLRSSSVPGRARFRAVVRPYTADMPVDLDPTSTSANLSDLVRAVLLLMGGLALGIILSGTLLLSRRWAWMRTTRRSRPIRTVDPWVESGRRMNDPTERDTP